MISVVMLNIGLWRYFLGCIACIAKIHSIDAIEMPFWRLVWIQGPMC